MDEPTPQAWAREAWEESQLELLVPAAAGLALAQCMIAFFALHSYHWLLLWACLGGVTIAMVSSFIFLYRLSRDQKENLLTEMKGRDMRWLFLPSIASVFLYAAIAPNVSLAVFFLMVSLPHLSFNYYLANRYARLSPLFDGVSISIPRLPAVQLPRIQVPLFESVGLRVLALAAALKRVSASRTIASTLPLTE